MAIGFEAAGGIIEKFLPGVSLPVLMNTVLPGLLAGSAVFPFTFGRLRNFLSLNLETSWPQLVISAVTVITLGALISVLNDQFYGVYRGTIGWPSPLKKWVLDRRQRCVLRLLDMAESVRESNHQAFNDYWFKLRMYPVDKKTGERYAAYPTLLGNIIKEYEDYPRNRYGMDSTFYWPRLWLMVEKDQKERIEKSWSIADGLVSLSAVSFLAGVLWLATSLGARLHLLGPQWFPVGSSAFRFSLAVLGWCALGYLLYRISLPFHRQNGETFKSLFDLYRGKLQPLTALAPRESDHWRATWEYLQYLQIPCPLCEKGHFSVLSRRCTNDQCLAHSQELPDVLEDFRRSGKLI